MQVNGLNGWNKEDMQQRTMDCETLNVKCVLGLVVFNSNQIYVT